LNMRFELKRKFTAVRFLIFALGSLLIAIGGYAQDDSFGQAKVDDDTELHIESGDDVYIKADGDNKDFYESMVFYAPAEPFLEVKGVSTARRVKADVNLADVIDWNIAIYGLVDGQLLCFYIDSAADAEIANVIKAVPLLRELKLDKANLHGPMDNIKSYIPTINSDGWRGVKKQARKKAEYTLSLPDDKASTFVEYYKRAFKDADLKCAVITGGWRELVKKFKFDGSKEQQTISKPISVQMAALEKAKADLRIEIELLRQEGNTVQKTNNRLRKENKGLAAGVRANEQTIATQENKKLEIESEIKGLENQKKSAIDAKAKKTDPVTSPAQLTIATANSVATIESNTISIMAEHAALGPEIKATHDFAKGSSSYGYKHSVINLGLVLTAVLLLIAILTAITFIFSRMKRSEAKTSEAFEGFQGAQTEHHNQVLSAVSKGGGNNAGQSNEGSEFMQQFVNDFHQKTNDKLIEANKVKTGIVRVIKELNEIAQNFDDGQNQSTKIDCNEFHMKVPSYSAQLPDYAGLQHAVDFLIDLIQGIGAALGNKESEIKKGIDELTAQIREKDIEIGNLKHETELLQETGAAMKKREVSQHAALEAKSGELFDLQRKTDKLGQSIVRYQQDIDKTLIEFGYKKEGADHEEEAHDLFMKDLVANPAHLSFSLNLIKLKQFLENVEPSDAQLYDACRLGELCIKLGDLNYFNLFMDGASQRRVVGWWKGPLSIIYRAELLLRTYWPDQQVLLDLLADCVAASQRLLHKRGIEPHKVVLLDSSVLISEVIEYNPENVINDDLKGLIAFAEKVKPLAAKELVYCDVAIWGSEQTATEDSNATSLATSLVGLNDDEDWSEIADA
jgi:hypothetical protein